MRLSIERPNQSLYAQNQRQSDGQVKDVDKGQSNTVNETELGTKSKDPLDDPQIRNQVMELQVIEDKVIAHEQAHKSVGGEFTGAANYGYSVGPDGKRYITSGEVSISIPSYNEPEDAIRAMERVKQAALAPVDPSAQDQGVAASAGARIISLQAEISKKKAVEAYGNGDEKAFVENVKELGEKSDTKNNEHINLLI